MKIAILGCGWFGCHIARHLIANQHSVTVFDGNGVFSCASGNNQDRTHLGFHYPRSARTRREIQTTYERFISTYPTVEITDNIYAVSDQSIIDLPTYLTICDSDHLKYEHILSKDFCLVGVEGAIRCHERVVNTAAVKAIFERELEPHLVREHARTLEQDGPRVRVNGTTFDACVNCTNLRFKPPELGVYYEAAMILTADGPTGHPSFTIMDGPFPTLLATCVPGKYTLSHVTHTALAKCTTYQMAASVLEATDWKDRQHRFVEGIERFYPRFGSLFKVTGCRKAVRTKPRNGTDSRECITHVDGRVLTVSCGKFMSVFLAEERVGRWLLELQN